MKRLFLIIAATAAFAFSSLAQQDTRGFSFQGIARDGSGNVYASQSIALTIYLQNGSTTVYEEKQSITTDAFGVFSAIIGSGTVQSGTGFAASISGVDFTKQLNVRIDVTLGTNTTTLVNYALQAVPYAKFAYSSTVAASAITASTASIAITATTATAAGNGCPPGTIMPFAGSKSNIPSGWLYCDGTQYSTTTYAALYAAIGTAWGSGSGTFRVPDLRGYFLRGANDATGRDPDVSSRLALNSGGNTADNVGTYQGDQFAAHTHTFIQAIDSTDAGKLSYPATNNDGGYETSKTSSTGGNETRPKNAAIYYIIKH